MKLFANTLTALSLSAFTIAQAAPLVKKTAHFPADLQKKLVNMNKDYLVFHPKQPGKHTKRPLIIFLHGKGQRGHSINKLKVPGPVEFANKNDFNFIVIAPQCLVDKSGNGKWDLNDIDHLLEHAKATYTVDPKRIYMTGQSMGGFGTWRYAAENPTKLAAIAPVCGGGDPRMGKKYGKLPIWAFHGDKDTIVPLSASERMVNAVKKAGGNAKLTIFEGVKHNSWVNAYAEKKLYSWFLSHQAPREAAK